MAPCNTMYKPVHRKVRPVPTTLPESARVTRQIPEDPLLTLPSLSPNPPEFIPTEKLTEERMKIFGLEDNTFLQPEEVKLFKEVIRLNEPAWAFKEKERSSFRDDYFTPYVIPVVEHVPWAERNMRIPPGILDQVIALLKEKIDAGVYEPSQSSYRSRWFCVLKKSGDLRIVHDLQPLNKVTIKDAGLPPNLDEYVEVFAGSSVYTVLDLFSGYYGRKLDESSRDLTSFFTPLGLLRLTSLPIGFTNAVPEFQNCTVFILQPEVPNVAAPFMDDLGIKGPPTRYQLSDGTYETIPQNSGIRRFIWEHANDVNRVVHRMKMAGASFSPKKAQMGKEEAEITGQLCTFEGRLPTPTRVTKINKWPSPTNLTEVRGFLGLCGTLRVWIRNYSAIARPLTELTRKNLPFSWDIRRQEAMDGLKYAVSTAPAIRPINYKSLNWVILEVDTSIIAIGFILSQLDDEGRRRPARFGSLPINEREAKYSQPKLELYGLFRALRNFRIFIIGVENLIVEMDAKYVKGMINDPDLHPNATMNRWIYGILMFDFVLCHVPAKIFKGPDGLSRRRRANDDSDEETAEDAEAWIDNLLDFRICKTTTPPPTTPFAKVYATQEGDLDNIYQFLETLQTPRFSTQEEKTNFLNRAKRFFIQNNRLWRRSKKGPLEVIMDEAKRHHLLEEAHDHLGHRGVFGSLQTLQSRFWWPTLIQDVEHFVKTCHDCQTRSTKKVQRPITVSLPATIFTRIYLDVFLMPPSKGYRYIVAARDDLSGCAKGRKLRKNNSRAIAKFIWEEIICQYGHIGSITTDNGPETKGATEELLRRYNIPQIRISPYNSRANGVVERGHFIIREAIVKACKGNIKQWPDFVDQAFFADKITTRKATGFSPFYMLHGVDPVLPFDLVEATYLVSGFTENMSTEDLLALRIQQLSKREEDILQAAQMIARSRFRSKAHFERHYARRMTTELYPAGKLVLVRNSRIEDELDRKTKPRYLGPYIVVRCTSKGSYVLKEMDGTISRRGIQSYTATSATHCHFGHPAKHGNEARKFINKLK